MAIGHSEALRNALASQRANIRAYFRGTITFAASTKKISHASQDFLAAGFRVGDRLNIKGTTSNNTTDSTFKTITAIGGTGNSEITVSETLTDESAVTNTDLISLDSGCFADLFQKCTIELYSGTRPTTAGGTHTSTLVATITDNGGSFVSGSYANGLDYDPTSVSTGRIPKLSSQTWKGTSGQALTINWGRVISAKDSDICWDFSVNTSGSDMNLPNIVPGVGTVIQVDNAGWRSPA